MEELAGLGRHENHPVGCFKNDEKDIYFLKIGNLRARLDKNHNNGVV